MYLPLPAAPSSVEPRFVTAKVRQFTAYGSSSPSEKTTLFPLTLALLKFASRVLYAGDFFALSNEATTSDGETLEPSENFAEARDTVRVRPLRL